MVHNSILGMEEKMVALEAKDILTNSHQQLVIYISKMLETICDKFKAYHYEIVAGLETDNAMRQEQVFFGEHQGKTMKFVDHLGNLLAYPSQAFLLQL